MTAVKAVAYKAGEESPARRGFQRRFDFIGKRFADFANTYTVDGYALMGRRSRP